MIRFVRPVGDEPFVGGLLHGRGHYLCPEENCLHLLEKRLRRWFSTEEIERALPGLAKEIERRRIEGAGSNP